MMRLESFQSMFFFFSSLTLIHLSYCGLSPGHLTESNQHYLVATVGPETRHVINLLCVFVFVVRLFFFCPLDACFFFQFLKKVFLILILGLYECRIMI